MVAGKFHLLAEAENQKIRSIDTPIEMTNKTLESKLNLLNIKGDFFGGLTAGVVTLPLALAFGLQSGLSPISGLYCAIFLGGIAVVFGGTNTLILPDFRESCVIPALARSDSTETIATGLYTP